MISGIITLACTLAADVHFAMRLVRHWKDGNRWASAVSLALCFIVLGPTVVAAIAHGFLRPAAYPALGWVAMCIALGLVLAILRVEEQDRQRKAVREARRDAARVVQTRVGQAPTVKPPPPAA